jgi:tetratricopeptide (TPR) repeat protein
MLTLLADLGDLLRLHPAYNAATVVELAQHVSETRILPKILHWATPDPLESPARFTLEAAGYTLEPHYPDWDWAEREREALFGYLKQFPQSSERLNIAGQLERDLADWLTSPLEASSIYALSSLERIKNHHQQMGHALEEGVATAYRQKRLDALERSLLPISDGIALVSLDDLPELLGRIPQAVLPDLAGFKVGEASRVRALCDRALRLEESDDLALLMQSLMRETGDTLTPLAELEYAASGIYLSVGDLESSKVLLEQAGHAQLEHPRYLFGLVYARLGQVRDALGDRTGALRAYRATLALNYAPTAALEVAKQGLEGAFGFS